MIRRNRQMNRQPLPIIWQRIIFDPLSYIHPQRLQIAPEMIVRPAARAAANELILAAWRLKNGEKECIQNSLTQLWLRQWRRLPQVAYLLGCHKLRADLARQEPCLACRIGRKHFWQCIREQVYLSAIRRRITGFYLASGMHS